MHERGQLLINAWAHRHGMPLSEVAGLSGHHLKALQPEMSLWLEGLVADPVWIDDQPGALSRLIRHVLPRVAEVRETIRWHLLPDSRVAYSGITDEALTTFREGLE